jgi:lysophospholipase L1-like esterase
MRWEPLWQKAKSTACGLWQWIGSLRAHMKFLGTRRQWMLAIAATAVAGCSRFKPPIIHVEDYERRRRRGGGAIRIACAGDSITFGAGVEDREKNNYPKVLGDFLGASFDTRNFGRSGATLSSTGDLPYATTDEYKAMVEFLPDVIILKLGTNDTKPQNWKGRKVFDMELKAMIETLRKLKSKPKVWVCLPVPVYGDQWGINTATLDDGVIPSILEVCNDRKIPVIDLNDALSNHPEMFPDKIHPNAAGAALMAKTVYQAIRP